MGVTGLSPFLQKNTPHLIRSLSRRWREISGSTVVLDGNLLVQRFHFGALYESHKHLNGFLRLLSDTRRANVRVIAVFDGAGRLPQKRLELERRAHSRAMSEERLGREEARVERIDSVRGAVQKALALPVDQRQAIVDELEGWKDRLRAVAAGEWERLPQAHSPPSPDVEGRAFGPEFDQLRTSLSSIYLSVEAAHVLPSVPPFPEELPAPSTRPVAPVPDTATQKAVAADELAFLSTLSLSPTASDMRAFNALQKKAEDAAAIYDRAPPRSYMYEQARTLLRAAGVPVFEVEGLHEGEALAASIACAGLADYVASEDSDVLIYGARLIRQVSGWGDFQVYDGTRLASSLDLSPAQLIDFALLCGTDFAPKIPLLGPAKALKAIQQHHTIETLLSSTPTHIISLSRGSKTQAPRSLEAYLEHVQAAREVFARPPPPPERSEVVWARWDEERVRGALKGMGVEPEEVGLVGQVVDADLDVDVEVELEMLERGKRVEWGGGSWGGSGTTWGGGGG